MSVDLKTDAVLLSVNTGISVKSWKDIGCNWSWMRGPYFIDDDLNRAYTMMCYLRTAKLIRVYWPSFMFLLFSYKIFVLLFVDRVLPNLPISDPQALLIYSFNFTCTLLSGFVSLLLCPQCWSAIGKLRGFPLPRIEPLPRNLDLIARTDHMYVVIYVRIVSFFVILLYSGVMTTYSFTRDDVRTFFGSKLLGFTSTAMFVDRATLVGHFLLTSDTPAICVCGLLMYCSVICTFEFISGSDISYIRAVSSILVTFFLLIGVHIGSIRSRSLFKSTYDGRFAAQSISQHAETLRLTEVRQKVLFLKIVHDLRTPLNGIINSLAFLRHDAMVIDENEQQLEQRKHQLRYLLMQQSILPINSKLRDDHEEMSYDERSNFLRDKSISLDSTDFISISQSSKKTNKIDDKEYTSLSDKTYQSVDDSLKNVTKIDSVKFNQLVSELFNNTDSVCISEHLDALDASLRFLETLVSNLIHVARHTRQEHLLKVNTYYSILNTNNGKLPTLPLDHSFEFAKDYQTGDLNYMKNNNLFQPTSCYRSSPAPPFHDFCFCCPKKFRWNALDHFDNESSQYEHKKDLFGLKNSLFSSEIDRNQQHQDGPVEKKTHDVPPPLNISVDETNNNNLSVANHQEVHSDSLSATGRFEAKPPPLSPFPNLVCANSQYKWTRVDDIISLVFIQAILMNMPTASIRKIHLSCWISRAPNLPSHHLQKSASQISNPMHATSSSNTYPIAIRKTSNHSDDANLSHANHKDSKREPLNDIIPYIPSIFLPPKVKPFFAPYITHQQQEYDNEMHNFHTAEHSNIDPKVSKSCAYSLLPYLTKLPCRMKGSSTFMLQIINNAFANSFKATPDGGSIALHCVISSMSFNQKQTDDLEKNDVLSHNSVLTGPTDQELRQSNWDSGFECPFSHIGPAMDYALLYRLQNGFRSKKNSQTSPHLDFSNEKNPFRQPKSPIITTTNNGNLNMFYPENNNSLLLKETSISKSKLSISPHNMLDKVPKTSHYHHSVKSDNPTTLPPMKESDSSTVASFKSTNENAICEYLHDNTEYNDNDMVSMESGTHLKSSHTSPPFLTGESSRKKPSHGANFITADRRLSLDLEDFQTASHALLPASSSLEKKRNGGFLSSHRPKIEKDNLEAFDTMTLEDMQEEDARMDIFIIDSGKGVLNSNDVKSPTSDVLFSEFLQGSHEIKPLNDKVSDDGKVDYLTFGSMGLGLSIVKHLAKNMEGGCGLYSEGENKGAILHVWIPIKLQKNLMSDLSTLDKTVNQTIEKSFSFPAPYFNDKRVKNNDILNYSKKVNKSTILNNSTLPSFSSLETKSSTTENILKQNICNDKFASIKPLPRFNKQMQKSTNESTFLPLSPCSDSSSNFNLTSSLKSEDSKFETSLLNTEKSIGAVSHSKSTPALSNRRLKRKNLKVSFTMPALKLPKSNSNNKTDTDEIRQFKLRYSKKFGHTRSQRENPALNTHMIEKSPAMRKGLKKNNFYNKACFTSSYALSRIHHNLPMYFGGSSSDDHDTRSKGVGFASLFKSTKVAPKDTAQKLKNAITSRVLIVDDEMINRLVLQTICQKSLGSEVEILTASDVRSAQNILVDLYDKNDVENRLEKGVENMTDGHQIKACANSSNSASSPDHNVSNNLDPVLSSLKNVRNKNSDLESVTEKMKLINLKSSPAYDEDHSTENKIYVDDYVRPADSNKIELYGNNVTDHQVDKKYMLNAKPDILSSSSCTSKLLHTSPLNIELIAPLPRVSPNSTQLDVEDKYKNNSVLIDNSAKVDNMHKSDYLPLLIVTDLYIPPDVNAGLSLAKFVRAHKIPAMIVLSTAFDSSECVEQENKESGFCLFDALLPKPVKPADLQELHKTLMERCAKPQQP